MEIFQQNLMNGNRVVGRIAIIRGGLNEENPTAVLNNAVSNYVGQTPYNEFVEIYLDNPWVRVIVSGINELNYQPFVNQHLGDQNI